jgi:hypothetical protein
MKCLARCGSANHSVVVHIPLNRVVVVDQVLVFPDVYVHEPLAGEATGAGVRAGHVQPGGAVVAE